MDGRRRSLRVKKQEPDLEAAPGAAKIEEVKDEEKKEEEEVANVKKSAATRSSRRKTLNIAVTPSPARSTDSSEILDAPAFVASVDILDRKRKEPPELTSKKQPVRKRAAKVAPAAVHSSEPELKVSEANQSLENPFIVVSLKVEAENYASLPNPDSSTSSSSSIVPVAPDGNGGLNKPSPFSVEYAKMGTATCKRCDMRISKGEVRISHSPLFRGRPGYKVFRHLHCAVFSPDVICAEDVSGYSLLAPQDYLALALQVEESLMEIKRESEEIDPDELVPVTFEGETRCPPVGLVANLLPFQIEGLSWMYHQEVHVDTIRGGILADEMGMGKTIQTIATILDNRSKLQYSVPDAKFPPGSDKSILAAEEALWKKSLVDWKHEMAMNDVPSYLLSKGKGGARAGTLVICPVIALTQWKAEIEKFCNDGTLSVVVYHGPNRASETPRDMLRKYDVVLTTYQVLEADFRKMVSPNRVTCPNCGGKFKIDKLRVHLKYFCGEGAQRTVAQLRQRRNRDPAPGERDHRGGRGEGRGGGGKTSEKKSFSAQKAPQSKPKISIKKNADYASESELSVASNDTDEEEKRSKGVWSSSGRPARAAASKAMTRISTSAKSHSDKKSGGESDDDSDEYVEEPVSETSDDETAKSKIPKAVTPKSTFKKDEASDDEDDVVVKNVKAKQAIAFEAARSSMNKKGLKKKGEDKSFKQKQSQKVAVKGGGKSNSKQNAKPSDDKKKTFDKNKKDSSDSNHSSSSDDSDSGSDSEIDMDRLVEEATVGAKMSVMHSLCWWRVVLDEAHMIKSRGSQTAKAAFALIGIHRWCLSGTPLQNRVGEFYSLVRFLRLDPMAHYICRNRACDCTSLHYRMMNGKCRDCGHGSVQHYSHFNKYILNPIQTDGYSGDGRRAMFVLKNEVLDKCLLRRTKQTRAEDMNLPPRLVAIRAVRLHPVEEDFYNALYTQTRSSFDDYVQDGTLLNNYAHIFDLLMRMRQSVDHPYLVVFSKKDSPSYSSSGPAIANGTTDCDICHEPPTDRVVSSCCQAAFCRACVIEYMETSAGLSNGTPCPSCRNPFSIDLNQDQQDVVDDSTLSVNFSSKQSSNSSSSVGMPSLKELPHVATGSILRRMNLVEFATSTKIEALAEELVKMRQSSPGSKAIVFSQFVNMLDLIRWRLHSDPCLADMGLGARALHGGMDVKARDGSLKDFREDHNVRVLLISLKAGGVALNLTVANHIFLMDPWWNPAAEMQAIDRTHRLGQYRPIKAIRFIAENTVEERILQLQEKKRLVFDGTVGRDAASLKMLTVDDMKALFA